MRVSLRSSAYSGMTAALVLSVYFLFFDRFIRRGKAPLATKGAGISEVIESSEIESKFMSLEVRNCSYDTDSISSKMHNSHWQQVDDKEIYVYRSYYDYRFVYMHRRYDFVRVLVAAYREAFESPLYCHLSFSSLPYLLVFESEVEEIWGPSWNADPGPGIYSTFLISCPVPLEISRASKIPILVSLSLKPCANLTNILPVLDTKGKDNLQQKKSFAICVKGLDFQSDISHRIIEWLEMNLSLGAEEVFIYVYSVHRNVTRILDYYANKGTVSVIPLSLPGRQPNEPNARRKYLRRFIWKRRRNEILPYNDCLYRNIYKYEYIIPLDVDEVIIPTQDYTWQEMMARFARNSGSRDASERFSSLSVQNAYFLDVFQQNRSSSEFPACFHMLNHRIRSANFSLFGHSVKSFVFTNNTKTVFNHYALQPLYSKTKKNQVLDISFAQMNHYKDRCPREMYTQCVNKFLKYTVTDNIILKYRKQLFSRVYKVYSDLNLNTSQFMFN